MLATQPNTFLNALHKYLTSDKHFLEAHSKKSSEWG